MKTNYTPIDPAYFEIVGNEILKDKISRVFYFEHKKSIGEEKGKITTISTLNNFEKY